ncbi:Ribonuclease III [Metarhizium guizhouense ARSEF 977]|uniref:Ribonuclease III n=1 Tax=Metarhizium guizhouense (strain ARSEF 977) TaxID=1276136 RepID=A0A0B4HAY3_METGA|nr:Ribonuclease III [Metarhizium guizhouense ARSEF 977]
MAPHQVEQTLQYNFKDPALLDEALVAAGAGPKKAKTARNKGNKVLALVGDALLRLVLVDDSVVAGQTPCKILRRNVRLQQEWKLASFIKTPTKKNSNVPCTTGASTMEALVGAVWLDSGRDLRVVHHVIHNLKIGQSLLEGNKHNYGGT